MIAILCRCYDWIKDKDVNYFYNQKLIYSYLNQSRVY
jgi:hypothetical protein